ncbi:MAG: CHAT domain-containing protein [Gemmatimonadota bacterium]|nr:MAG: CHAT domain-containing protein [Gemmatimonadota bacterium]
MSSAEKAYWAGEFDEAQASFRLALEMARSQSDSLAESEVLTWLGLAAWRTGDYKAARRLGEEALRLKLHLGLEDKLSRSYNALGLLAWNESRLSDATDLFRLAAAAARGVGDQRRLVAAEGNLALVLTDLGRFTEARRGFNGMREAGRALGDARIEGNALNNLAMLDIKVGNPVAAVESLREARRLYESIDYATGEQNALGQLATAYDALGEPSLAFAALDSALALTRRQGLRQEEASNLEIMAEFYLKAGDYRRALELYRDANEINEELGLQIEIGVNLRSAAEIHALLGDLGLAGRYVDEALRIHQETGAPLEELFDLAVSAEMAHERGAHEEAQRHLSVADSLSRGLGVRSARVEIALTRARLADQDRDGAEVLRVLETVQDDLTRGGYGTEWQAHALAARAYSRLGVLDSAVVEGQRAVAAVERARARFSTGYLRTSYLSDKASVYSDLVLVHLRRGEIEEAFQVADAGRGRALLEHLTAARHELGSTGSAAELAEAEEVLRRIDELLTRLGEVEEVPSGERGADFVASEEELTSALAAARSEYESLRSRALVRDIGGATLLGSAPASAGSIVSVLEPGEALLEYLVTPDRVLLFVVTQQGILSLEASSGSIGLLSRIRVARDLLARRRRWSDANAALARLYNDLIRPAVTAGALEGVHRLIIVPHAELSYLPFAALRDQASGRYLAEGFSLLHLPTAAALPILRAGDTHGPQVRSAPGRSFAPFPRRLPATREEVAAFAEALPEAGTFIGDRATEAELRRALSDGAIVHVATHGVLNSRNPMFSRIELRGDATDGRPSDGRLEVHELLGLKVRSPLVFLSGCETGVGVAWSTEYRRGEDFATLAQAFLYAGAGNVIATLWPVDDAGAGVFAARFYRHLQDAPPVEALARAQRDMMADSTYEAPYYWAAYTLSGGRELGIAPQ